MEQEFGNALPGFSISQDGSIITNNEVIRRRLDKEEKFYRLFVTAEDNAPEDIRKLNQTKAYVSVSFLINIGNTRYSNADSEECNKRLF